MKKIYSIAAILMVALTSCGEPDYSKATVDDIKKTCEKKDWATAKKMCDAFIQKDRTNAVVLKCLGDAYLGLNDSIFAQYSYDQALELDSNYVDAMVGSADMLMNSGDATVAINKLRSQIENHPDNAKLYNALGCAFRVDGNDNEARANFERAVSLDPEFSLARKNLAWMQIDSRDLDDAILTLETLLDSDPNQADAYNGLGLAYEYKNDTAEAVKMFMKAISVDEKCILALENLAYHYKVNGDLSRAKKYYEKAAAFGSKTSKELLKNSMFDNK